MKHIIDQIKLAQAMADIEHNNNNNIPMDNPFEERDPNYMGDVEVMDFGQDYEGATRDPSSDADPVREPSVAYSKEAQKTNLRNFQKKDALNQKNATEYHKKIKEYMTKRQGLIDKTEIGIRNLDRIYADQGPNMQPLARAVDMGLGRNGGRRNLYDANPQQAPQFEKQYMQDRISPQQMVMLRNKLNQQSEKNYGGLTDDATNALNAANQSDLAKLQIASMKAAKDSGMEITPKMQQAARQNFLGSKPLMELKDDVKLTRAMIRYKEAMEKVKGGLDRIRGPQRVELEAAYKGALFAMNTYEANLGALSGGDDAHLKGALVPVAGLEGALKQLANGATDRDLINVVNKVINNGRQRSSENYNYLKDGFPSGFGTGELLSGAKRSLDSLKGDYSPKKSGGGAQTTDDLDSMTLEELQALDSKEGR